MFCIQRMCPKSGYFTTFGPLFGQFLGPIWCRFRGNMGPERGPARKGQKPVFCDRAAATSQKLSYFDHFWQKPIKICQKTWKKHVFFIFFGFDRFWPFLAVLTKTLGFCSLKGSLWDHPKIGGSRSSFTTSIFWGSKKRPKKTSKNESIFGDFRYPQILTIL